MDIAERRARTFVGIFAVAATLGVFLYEKFSVADRLVSLDEGDTLHEVLGCLMAALEPLDPPWRTAPDGLATAALRPAPAALPEMVAEFVNTLDACDVAHGVIVLVTPTLRRATSRPFR